MATSLTQSESVLKQIAILKIYKDQFKMKYLKLNTVRPFVFERLNINEYNDAISSLQCRIEEDIGLVLKSRTQAVEDFVDNYIKNNLLPKARKQETG